MVSNFTQLIGILNQIGLTFCTRPITRILFDHLLTYNHIWITKRCHSNVMTAFCHQYTGFYREHTGINSVLCLFT
ncbi:hypothetical protein D3C71_1824050 [compost metagenome]